MRQIQREKLRGALLGLAFCMVTAVDGLLRLLNFSHITGSYNYLFALCAGSILAMMLALRPKSLWREISKKKSFYTLVSLLLFSLIAGVTVVINGNVTSLLMELGYVGLYVLAFLVFNIYIFENEIVHRSFFYVVLIVSGVMLPVAAFGFGWFNLNGRFEGFYAAASLSGNIAAILGGYVISSMQKLNSRGIYKLVLVVSLGVVIITGTRSGLLILLVSFIFSRHSVITDVKTKLVFSSIFLLVGVYLFSAYGYEFLINSVYASQGSRIIAINDGSEVGSLGTRLQWIDTILSQLASENPFGGFGPGSAREEVGHIIHFDVLKTYYDYSALGLVALIGVLLFSSHSDNTYTWVKNLIIIFLLSFHNLLLSPVLLIFLIAFILTERKVNHAA